MVRPAGHHGRWWSVQLGADAWLVLVAEPLAERWAVDVLSTVVAMPRPAPPPGGVGGALHWFRAPSGFPADAPQNQADVLATLRGLGSALRRLHDAPVPGDVGGSRCLGPAELVERAERAVAAGTVDGSRLAAARAHLPPSRIVEQLRDLLPVLEARAGRRPVTPALTIGEVALDTIWLDGGEPTAFIDVAALAVTDPYRDVAALTRDLAARFGPEALAPFLDAYGDGAPDAVRLEFHALLDELR